MEKRKVALITGASSGIGRGVVLRLAGQGYDIAFSYRNNGDGAEQTRAEAERRGAACRYYRADMNRPGDPERLVEAAYRDFGRIDAIVCGAAKDLRPSVLTVTASEIEDAMRQLYAAQILAAGAAARHMVKDGIPGGIVFISSIHGQMPMTSDFLYGGMKAALERSCRSMALELSPYRIRVNCVAPGAINVRSTDDSGSCYSALVPLGHRGVPEDVAAAVGFLLSEDGGYITGEIIRVDGGMALPGQPEGWADPHPVNLEFVRNAYRKMMEHEEENGDV